jgi:uncharacterized DUF497 family protein
MYLQGRPVASELHSTIRRFYITPMRRITLDWDAESIEHISAHQVEPADVEAVLQKRYLLERGRRNRYYVLGQTDGGRYLFVVLARKRSGSFRVMTARGMTPNERRRFRRRMKRDG